MNKSVIITIAIIVGLLALWLVVLLVYPTKQEEGTQEPANTVVNQGQVLVPAGATSQSVVATVEIVDNLAEVGTGDAVNAQVSIED